MANQKTESQAYKVVKIEKDFEIRFYPSSTMAMILSSTKTYKDLGSPGFRKLAGYIFGGNKEKKQIPMTSPVHMDINNIQSSMAFVMPSKLKLDDLPEPNDQNVMIKTVPEEYVAAVGFGGFASEERIKKYQDFLDNALKKAGIAYYGNFRFLGYSPPYQLLGRRNEIIVSVKGFNL